MISEREARALATLISALLDKVGCYHALLADMGSDPGDDVDRILIAGQRVVHRLRLAVDDREERSLR